VPQIHARFAKVLRHAPMLVWMSDASGAVTFVNRKWLTFTGRRLRDELGDGWTASVHPDDLQSCTREYHAALAEQRPFALEYRLRRSDHVYRTVSDSGLPLHEQDGRFAGYVGTCIDVTAQREGAEALERTLEHLTLVGAYADEMIYRLRLQPLPQVEYMSPGISRIVGISREEFFGSPEALMDRVHPDDRARLRDLRVGPPDPNARVIMRWRHEGGRIVWAEHRRLPVYDADGNLVAIDGIARDITRQKELEDERDAQIAMLNGLIGHMNDGVFAETADGQVAVVNAAFGRIFDIPGVTGRTIGAAELRALAGAQLADPARSGQIRPPFAEASTVDELRLADGRTLEQEHFSVRLEDDRTINVWQFRDITLRKREEDELRTSRHRLRDLSAHLEAAREEERRDLARTLHDEVGQLLTGIRLEVASAVERFRKVGTPAEFPIVDRLQAAVGLVDLSIATVQRVTSALHPPVLEHLGLVPAIRWEAAVFRGRTGIRCRISPGSADVEDRAIATTLYRILLEALTNVARHANAGTVWISLRQRPGRVTMEVRDNGKGISDEALHNRSAMGLLGMRERALAAGGDLRVARRKTGGTSVIATLPLPVTPPAAPATSNG